MPRIMPLRGLRYTAKAGSASQLLAPPFDVIGAGERERLAELSPYNAVRLELAEASEERDAAVASELAGWIEDGVLARDPEPMLYVYEQVFVEAGQERRRRALICGVESQPWEEGAVKPHEFTLSAPKEDRLRLLQATGTQFSPIFMLARDRSGQLAGLLAAIAEGGDPDLTGDTPDGVSHRLWALPAERHALRPLAPLLSEAFYIADGHHRYETSLAYRRWLAESEGELASDHPARFAMAGIVPASDEGLVVRPLHRLVPRSVPEDWEGRIGATFSVTEIEVPQEPAALAAAIEREVGGIIAINLVPDRVHLLRAHNSDGVTALAPSGASARWVAQPPNLLRFGVLNPLWEITDEELRDGAVEFTHDIAEVLTGTQEGSVGFLLHPVAASDVMALADGGERLPQKSTFYYPKLGTGLVFSPLTP